MRSGYRRFSAIAQGSHQDDLEQVESLLALEDIDINEEHLGLTPVEVAVGSEKVEILKKLIIAPKIILDPRESDQRLRSENRKKHHIYDSEAFHNGGDVHDYATFTDGPLHLAVEARNVEIIRILAKAGADVNARDGINEAPVHVAAHSDKRAECIKVLAELGADLNTVGGLKSSLINSGQPLIIASLEGNAKCMQALINAGAELEAKNKPQTLNALACTINKQSMKCLKVLLKNGADVNAIFRENEPMLHRFCEFRWLDGVKALIAKGVDLNVVDGRGYSALHHMTWFARDKDDPKCLEALLSAGANVNF